MFEFKELDPRAPIESQLSDTGGPVVLLNVFTLEPQDAEAFLQAWSAGSAFFKKQPGYISTQLHQGVGGSTMYVNYAVWESAAAFAAAFHNPEFKETSKQFPASVTALPHLIRKVAVPGYCVA
jgi:heme-degrading monooxygenase HmoA